MTNPLLTPSTLPYQLPPFADIKVEHYRPRIVAFTSKRGASETLGQPTGKLPYGPQIPPLGWPGGSELWVLPSTSPLGHTHFRIEPWQALADRVRELRGNPEAGRDVL